LKHVFKRCFNDILSENLQSKHQQKKKLDATNLAVGKPLNPVLGVSEIEVKGGFKIQFNCWNVAYRAE
jgi:hypothetical protein